MTTVAAGLLTLWLAFVNHRSAERSVARIARHVVVIAGVLIGGILLLGPLSRAN